MVTIQGGLGFHPKGTLEVFPPINMEKKMSIFRIKLIAIFGLMAFTLSACGEKQATTDTSEVNAIYTQAAATVGAKLTQTASAYTNTPAVANTQVEQPTLGATRTPLITNTPEFTSTPLVIATKVPTAQASCDNMQFMSDVTIPDGSQVAPGSKFVKTWRIRNNGQCAWSTNYRLIFGWSSDSWTEIRTSPPAAVKLTKEVVAGGEYEVTVALTAPSRSGSYQAAFRLQNDKGYNFGTILYILFQVNGTATP